MRKNIILLFSISFCLVFGNGSNMAFAATKVNGSCGSSNNGGFASAPKSNLCKAGTASGVSGSGPWAWSCGGTNGGTTAQCLAYSNTWSSSSFASQSGTFTLAFNATPAKNAEDETVGLSLKKAAVYSDLAAIIRFADSGKIDVRKAGVYTSQVSLAYTAGAVYHVRMVVNMTAHTYSVYVTAPGNSEVTLALNYAFRSEQASVKSLAFLNKFSAGDGDVTLANVVLTPSSPVNGSCGSANGVAVSKAPTTNFCSTGTATAISGSGPWGWSCTGTNGGTTATCSAPVLAPPPPASCGSTASGATVTKTVSTTSGTTSATTTQCPFGGTEPTTTTVTQTYLCTNGALTTQGSPVSTTVDSGSPTCNAPAACGSTFSGSTVTKTVSTTSGTTSATTTQCPFGGTEPTTTTVTQVYLCTNGALTTQGNPVSTTVDSGSPTCNAPAACGSTASGSTVTKTVSTTSGTTSATTTQCPFGGTEPTTTTVTQVYLCTNGALTTQGNPVSTTVDSGSPTCNAPAACGSTASGSTVTQTVSTTSGTTAATTTQCPFGGTEPTTTTVTQVYLCTNGTLTTQGSPVSTTVDSGSPTCNPAPVNGTCGSANGATVSSAPTSSLCSTGTASALSGNGPWSWSCVGTNGGSTASCSDQIASTGGTCPKGSTYADGCLGAEVGTEQISTMLNGYNTRPSWNVAGVDYAVGVPSGTVLKDPTTAALPIGCTFSGTTVSCSGSNVTLDGYDFSLHNGTTLNITGSNVTIKNSLFVVGSNQGSLGRIINVSSSAGNVTFLNNEVNGNNVAVTVGSGQTILDSNVGTITFEYNYFHNSGGDMIDFGGGPQVQILKYNLWKDVGLNTAHSDTVQWCGSKITSADLSFNVVDQTVSGLSGMGLLEPNSECTGAAMSNLIEHNNTLISKVQDNFALGVDVTQDAGTAIGDHVAIFNNYVDPTGINAFTGSPWFPTGYYTSNLAHPTLMYGLTNMLTGSAIPIPTKSNPTSISPHYYVYPDNSGYSPSMNDVYTIAAAPATGTLNTGNTVTLTLNMAEPWNVTGIPTLSLNDGGVATYVSGSGTNALVFTHTITAGNTAVANLSVTGITLPSGTAVKDNFGNQANLTNLTSIFTGLAISPSTTSPVNGSCGSANGTAVSSAPLSNLCSAGTATATSGSGPWSWSCNGNNGGTTASCSAPLQPAAVNGTCGSANGTAVTSAPTTNLCSTGSASTITETGTTLWNWNCTGTNGGTTAICSAPVQPAVVNGTCGSSNGTSFTTAPSTNLCTVGTATAVSGTGPWSWGCNGSNGGSNASCSASVLSISSSSAVNGNCGSAYGVVATSAPASNLCVSGTATSVSGTGPWTWSCNGSNGGTQALCVTPIHGTGVVGTWPGQAGNPVGYAAYGPLGTTPWPGGSFVSGTAANPKVYTGYVFTGSQTISGSYIEFISCDFIGGASISGTNLTFIGDRFQSNNVPGYNVVTTGKNLVFNYNSFTPLASMYTMPPGAAWPSAGAGMNTTTQVTGVNAIGPSDGYQYGLSVNAGGPVTMDHNDFWGFGNDGPQLMGTSAQVNITNNWVHDAANGSGGYHTDGLGYVNGGAGPSNVLVQGNVVASIGNTQALAFQGATSGYNNIQIINNYVGGFGYTVEPAAGSTVPFSNSSFTNNVLGTDMAIYYGQLYGVPNSGTAWKCNTYHVAPGTTWSTQNNNFTPIPSYDGEFWIPNCSYCNQVSATDYLGNNTCPNTHGGSSTPPGVPTNVSAVATSSTQVNLTWTASTDNVGVVGYKIFRNGTEAGSSTTTSYSDTGLTTVTAYTYTVSALDALGNNSAQSAGAGVTTM